MAISNYVQAQGDHAGISTLTAIPYKQKLYLIIKLALPSHARGGVKARDVLCKSLGFVRLEP